MNNKKYYVEAIIFLTYAVFGMTWAATGNSIGQIMKSLDLGLAEAGFISTSVSLAKIFGTAVAGYIAAQIGLFKAFLLASTLISVGILAPLAPSFELLLVARFVMGLGGAFVVVYFYPLVMEWFEPHERPIINGINFVSINVGMAVALFFTDELTVLFGSWRNVLIFYSSISIGLVILWALMGRGKNIRQVEIDSAQQNDDATYLQALKSANTWKLALTYCGALSFYLVLFTYYPVFFKSSGLPVDSIAIKAPAIAMLSGIFAAAVGILWGKKIPKRVPFVRWGGLIVVISAFVMSFVQNEIVIVISALLVGFGLFVWASPFNSIPQELPGMTPKKVGYMMGIFWAFSYLVATFNVWLFGYLVDLNGGFTNALLYICTMSATLFAGSFFLPETGGSQEKAEA